MNCSVRFGIIEVAGARERLTPAVRARIVPSTRSDMDGEWHARGFEEFHTASSSGPQ